MGISESKAKTFRGWFRAVIVSPSRTLQQVFFLSLGVAVYGAVASSNEPVVPLLRDTPVESFLMRLKIDNQIAFGTSVGYLTGVFVWFLLVWIPEQKKREIIRTNLLRKYRNFKHAILETLAHAAGVSLDSKKIERLCHDHREFRRIFDANNNQVWYDAMNGIADQEATHLDDILIEYQILSDELNYASNNIFVSDDEFHSFARRVREIVFRLSNYTSDRYNLEKLVGRYLWEILARWSYIDGQRDTDFVEEMINKI